MDSCMNILAYQTGSSYLPLISTEILKPLQENFRRKVLIFCYYLDDFWLLETLVKNVWLMLKTLNISFFQDGKKSRINENFHKKASN